MGVYKYFSIKNSEDQICYCISIKNALALGGKQGKASYEFDKTSELQVYIFELCFFFPSFPPPIKQLQQLALLLFWRLLQNLGDVRTSQKHAVPLLLMSVLCLLMFFTECPTFSCFLPELPLFMSVQMRSFVPKCENYQLNSVTTAATKGLLGWK